jgi:hypothetical protein
MPGPGPRPADPTRRREALSQPHVRRRRGLEGHPLIEEARSARQTLAALTARGVANPYFVPHQGISGPTIDMLGRANFNLIHDDIRPRIRHEPAGLLHSAGASERDQGALSKVARREHRVARQLE